MKFSPSQIGLNLALAVVLIAFGWGVNATYQKYQGTGLSRLPQNQSVSVSVPVQNETLTSMPVVSLAKHDVVAGNDSSRDSNEPVGRSGR